MPTASATSAKSPTRSLNQRQNLSTSSFFASTQSRFSTSKLIQNLGSGKDGVQFSFQQGLRTVHGRD